MYLAPLCTLRLPCEYFAARSCYSLSVVYRTTYSCASLRCSSTACSTLCPGRYYFGVLFTPILGWCSHVPATIPNSRNIDPRALSCSGRYNTTMYYSYRQLVGSGGRWIPTWYSCPVGSIIPSKYPTGGSCNCTSRPAVTPRL